VIAVVVMMALGVTAECVETSRNEPTVMITDGNQKHYIHLLEGERQLCESFVSHINREEARTICGCKHLTYWQNDTEFNTVGLKCAYIRAGHVVSRKVAEYFYHPEMIPACHRLGKLLMKKGL